MRVYFRHTHLCDFLVGGGSECVSSFLTAHHHHRDAVSAITSRHCFSLWFQQIAVCCMISSYLVYKDQLSLT